MKAEEMKYVIRSKEGKVIAGTNTKKSADKILADNWGSGLHYSKKAVEELNADKK